MQDIISALRSILGTADFYDVSNGSIGTWNYGAMIEYFVASLILCIVISSVFKFLRCLIK